eukprot:2415058-Pyramimonas_sp.AAC.1
MHTIIQNRQNTRVRSTLSSQKSKTRNPDFLDYGPMRRRSAEVSNRRQSRRGMSVRIIDGYWSTC